MSRVYLFVLSLILGFAVQFGDSYAYETYKNETDCSRSASGSDKTQLSLYEKIAQAFGLKTMNPFESFGFPFKKNNNTWSASAEIDIANPFGKIHVSSKKNIFLSGSYSEFLDKISKFGSNFPIYPGTKWCGNGDIAKDKNDLGLFKGADVCCRAHQNCNKNILAGETLANLVNNGLFPRSACTCDNAFYSCLKNISNLASNLVGKDVGFAYFTLLRPQCFECTCSTAICLNDETNTNCDNHCTKYKWVDNPKFHYFF